METKNTSRNIFDLPGGSNASTETESLSDVIKNESKKVPVDTYPKYSSYRRKAYRAADCNYKLSHSTYNQTQKRADEAKRKLDSAKQAKQLAENNYNNLKNSSTTQNQYTSTVGGIDIVSILKTAQEKKWLTVNQQNLLNKQPEEIIKQNGFTSKDQLSNFVKAILNTEWMGKLANPVMTLDIVKTKCIPLCFIIMAVTFLCSVISALIDNFNQPLAYIGGVGFGLGLLTIYRPIARFIIGIIFKNSVKKGSLISKSWGLIIELVVGVLIGQTAIGVLGAFREPLTTISASAIFSVLGAFYLRDAIILNNGVQKFVIKKYSPIKNSLYSLIFLEAETIQNINLGIYCILNQTKLAYLLDSANLEELTRNANSDVIKKSSALSQAESEYNKYYNDYLNQKNEYDKLSSELNTILSSIDEWNDSPSVNDMLRYNQEYGVDFDEDKYFPKAFWYESRNAYNKITSITKITHNYSPISLKVTCTDKISTTLVDNINISCKIIKAIQKMYPNKICNIYVLDPMASQATASFIKNGLDLVNYDSNSKQKPDDYIYSVSTQNEYRDLLKAISDKRQIINDYLHTPDHDKSSTANFISSFNDVRSQKNADLIPYDILLIYLPREDKGSSIFESPEALNNNLVGIDLSDYGVLPIYIHESLSPRWEELVKKCSFGYNITN